MNNTMAASNVKRLPIMISLIIGAFFTILNETSLNMPATSAIIDYFFSLPKKEISLSPSLLALKGEMC